MGDVVLVQRNMPLLVLLHFIRSLADNRLTLGDDLVVEPDVKLLRVLDPDLVQKLVRVPLQLVAVGALREVALYSERHYHCPICTSQQARRALPLKQRLNSRHARSWLRVMLRNSTLHDFKHRLACPRYFLISEIGSW